MDKLVDLLRRMSIKKRIQFAFIGLCLFPIGLIIIVNTFLEVYYFNQEEHRKMDHFAYESELRIDDKFEQLSYKFQYLIDNNDILTDLFLYQNNEEYHSEEVKIRIENTMESCIFRNFAFHCPPCTD